jgi:dynactin-5
MGFLHQTVVDKDVVIRGDLESVHVGHYCYIGERTVLRPPWMIDFVQENKRGDGDGEGGGGGGGGGQSGEGSVKNKNKNRATTCVWSRLTVGNHVVCGRDVVCEALAVGSCVQIGDGAVLGKHCVVKDCVLILPGAILPPMMVVPPFAIVGGAPAKIMGELPESAAAEYRLQAERTCRRRTFVKAPAK